MQKTSNILAIIILLSIFSFSNNGCDIQNTDFGEIDNLFEEAIIKGTVPGVVAIVTEKNKIIYHNAFGKMNVTNDIDMDENALFDIASMTKAFTSVGVMMLYERGEFELNDPVSKFIPSLNNFHVLNSFDPSDSTMLSQT